VAGPPGLGERTRTVFAGLFREAAAIEPSFTLQFLELEPDQAKSIGSLDVECFRVPHETKGVSLGFRMTLDGRRILYSGDSAWSDRFIALSQETDLFLCECHHLDTEVPYHMNYRELSRHVPRLGCKRLVLIHPGQEFLAAPEAVPLERAEDGMVIIL
jgi:ribonuclease BN (tRNA processing enzyme)